jgi:hypothetical protein
MTRRNTTPPKPRYSASILFDEATFYAARELADENCGGSVSKLVRNLIRQYQQTRKIKERQVSA